MTTREALRIASKCLRPRYSAIERVSPIALAGAIGVAFVVWLKGLAPLGTSLRYAMVSLVLIYAAYLALLLITAVTAFVYLQVGIVARPTKQRGGDPPARG